MPAPRSRVPTPAQWVTPDGIDPLIYGGAVPDEWQDALGFALSVMQDHYHLTPLLNAPPDRFTAGATYITIDLRAAHELIKGGDAKGRTLGGAFYLGATAAKKLRSTDGRRYLGSGQAVQRRLRARPRSEFVRFWLEVFPNIAEGWNAGAAVVAEAETRLHRRCRVLADHWFMNLTKTAAGIGNGNKGGRKWTDDALMADAAQYQTRAAWAKAPGSRYSVAHKRGLLEVCCAHMRDPTEVMKAAREAMFADPTWRANNKAAREAMYADPTWLERRRAAAKRLAEDPQWRANIKAANQRKATDPQWQAKNKAVGQRRSADPTWRANNKAAGQRRAADPHWQANNKSAREAMYTDPQWRANNKAAGQRRSEDPQWQANTKAANQRKAADPQWQANTKAANQRNATDPVIRERKSAALGILPRLPEPLRTTEARNLLAEAMLAHGREAVKDLVLRLGPTTMEELAAVLTPAPAMAAE